MDFLIVFADACNDKEPALKYLADNDLKIFILLSRKIKKFRDNQTFDYHKIHF